MARQLRCLLCQALLSAALLTLSSSCGPANEHPASADRRPRNVVLISIDSLRADHLGCYGSPRDTSPHLDALARRGVLFKTCVAESSWTLPSHASLLTGVSAGAHGVDHDGLSLPEDLPTLAELLSAAGWRTYGLWSGPYLHPLFGFGRGFAEGDYEGLLPSTRYDSDEFKNTGRARLDPHLPENLQAHRAATAVEVIDKALAFVDQVTDEPFFLFVHLFDVHYDYVAPESSWRPFAPEYDGPVDGLDFATDDSLRADMDPADLAQWLVLYDGEIVHTDAQIGRLLDRLQRGDRANDTVIIVTSDHGDEFFEHGQKGHRKTLFEEVLDVPLIMAGPGTGKPGRRLQGLSTHTDVVPTILDLLQLPAAEFATGISLAPALAGERLPDDRMVLSRLRRSAKRSLAAVRGAGWKVLIEERGRDGEELSCFDLANDPGEQHPLEDEALLSAARAALQRWNGREAYLRARLGVGAPTALPDGLSADLRALGYLR